MELHSEAFITFFINYLVIPKKIPTFAAQKQKSEKI